LKSLNLMLAVIAILIGGALLIGPNGIIIIVENPALRYGVGIVAVVLGVMGLAAGRK
jgi:hypothetical protein